MTGPSPPEIEFMMRIAELQRRINADARRSVLQIVAAIGIALAIGWALGRFWR
jgi:hypothetical protein